MRKTKINRLLLLAVLLSAAMGSMQAQRPVGDTLNSVYDDSTYYIDGYGWGGLEDTIVWYSNRIDLVHWALGAYQGDGCHLSGNLIRGVQMQTDRPLKILGIAAAAYLGTYHIWVEPCTAENTLDTTLAGRNTDSLKLYRMTPNGPEEIAGGPWRIENPHRHIVLPPYLPGGRPCGQSGPIHLDEPEPEGTLYEVIFDKPQVVIDSFVVAGTARNNEMAVIWQDNGSPKLYWEHPPTRYWVLNGRASVPDTEKTSWLWTAHHRQWFRHPNRDVIRTGGTYGREFALIYPIIDPDFDTTLCDAVRDVRSVEATDTTLTLMWNGGNNVQWEVQYMEVNGWEAWRETTRVPMVTLTGLHERTNYIVRVRGMCEWDTEYGPWSEWVDVYTGAHHDDPPDPQSISNLERFTQMMPNPARGLVTVLSSYRLSRVVVYDLAGHAVLEQEDDGLTTTFDVSGLAKGVYVVAIHTPAGIATKRLVVEGN